MSESSTPSGWPDAVYDAAARQAALDAWLQRNFDEAEQRRIRSLEGIGEI